MKKNVKKIKTIIMLCVLAVTTIVANPLSAASKLAGPQIVNGSGNPIDQAPYGMNTDLNFIIFGEDGREEFLTYDATFTSSNTSVGIMESGGKFKALDFGTTVITATYDNLTASTSINVPKPKTLGFMDSPSILSVGERFFFTLDGYDSGAGGSIDMKGLSNITSSDPSVVRIENGEFVALSPGFVTITAQFENITSKIELSVRGEAPVVDVVQSSQRNQGIIFINELRISMGLSILSENAALNNASQAHSDYLANVENPFFEGHFETAGKMGFTGQYPYERTRYAGYSGRSTGEVIHYIDNAENGAMMGLIAGPYHRVLLLDPAAVDIGIGVKTSTNTVSDLGYSNLDESKKNSIVYYPYPDQSGVSVSWRALEEPNPLESFGKKGAIVGFPITIASSVMSEGALEFTSATIKDSSGSAIDYYKTDNINGSSSKVIILTPKEKLKPGTKYTVDFSGQVKGKGMVSKTWSFTTQSETVSSIYLNSDKINMIVGQTRKITVNAVSNLGTETDVTSQATFVSSNPSVQVDNGIVKASKSVDLAAITVSYLGKSVTLSVKVQNDTSLPQPIPYKFTNSKLENKFAESMRNVGASLLTEDIRTFTAKIKDVRYHWAEPVVAWAIQSKIAEGYEDGSFRPDGNVTEAEFLAFVLRSLKVKEQADAKIIGHWADGIYSQAKPYNLPLSGYDSIEQRNQMINREKVAEIISAIDGVKLQRDEAIKYLLDKGYSHGKTANTIEGYHGHDKITRAETLQFILNLKVSDLSEVKGTN